MILEEMDAIEQALTRADIPGYRKKRKGKERAYDYYE
jgi:hypothetical protein